jgi:hypothetical protein
MPWMHCDLYVGFLIWLYYYRILRSQRKNPSLNMCFVRYEDFVSNPAKELDRVLQFLGLPFESAVAEGSGNREGIPQREHAWKSRALEKITTNRIGIWRRELSLVETGRLERLGRKHCSDWITNCRLRRRERYPRGSMQRSAGGFFAVRLNCPTDAC